jgi:CRP-like cAMP-binding protein
MNAKGILGQHLAQTIKLTEAQLDYFFSHFKEQTLKKGQSLIGPGDRVDCEYFVVGGCLKTFFINDDLKMYILQFSMPNWWASDFNALYTGTKASVGIDCVSDAQVLCLSAADREKVCYEIHEIEYFFRWRTNKGYVALQKRLLSLMNNDVRHRYEELIKTYPELYNLVPKHLIAAYLGVSRETLSRLYLS